MKTFESFPQPKITGQDRKNLMPFLGNWNALHEFLKLTEPDAVTLQKMILLESEGQNRPRMIHRLVGRFFSVQRASLYKALGIQDPKKAA